MKDERPPVWIGHVQLKVPDVQAARDFFMQLGMRDVFPEGTDVAILELRAGTHLIVQHSEDEVAPNTPATFDLMVEDIEATHQEFARSGLPVSDLKRGRIHKTFDITEPNGHVITYLSSHNSGLPV